MSSQPSPSDMTPTELDLHAEHICAWASQFGGTYLTQWQRDVLAHAYRQHRNDSPTLDTNHMNDEREVFIPNPYLTPLSLTPSITKAADGTATLNWPGPNPSTFSVARELFEYFVATINELTALKARRCDGCVHWQPATNGVIGSHAGCRRFLIWADPDHGCNAWEPMS